MSLLELIGEKEKIAERMAIVAAEKEAIDDRINEIVKPIMAQERLRQGKDTGSLTLLIEERVEVKQTLPKVVDWNQGLLKGLWAKIQSSGDNPESYIDQKFNISETKYKTFPDAIKKAFGPAREVKTGKPKLQFEIIPF